MKEEGYPIGWRKTVNAVFKEALSLEEYKEESYERTVSADEVPPHIRESIERQIRENPDAYYAKQGEVKKLLEEAKKRRSKGKFLRKLLRR